MRRATPLRNDPLANMLEDKRQASERRKELVQRLKLANALSHAPPSDAGRLPPREDSNRPSSLEANRNEHPFGEEPNLEVALASLSIDRLFDGTDTSVRLHNCFLNNRELFQQFTVAQALLDREKFFSDLTRCPNLGRKTAHEVLSIIDLYQEKPWPIAGHTPPEGVVDIEPGVPPPETECLPKAILDEEIKVILGNYDITTRLSNLLQSGGFDKITIADFIADPSAIKRRLMQAKNSGRKTANEAIGILSGHVQAARESSDLELDPSADSSSAIEICSEPPRQWLQGIIDGLPQKEKQVLTERYGLDGNSPQTLQDIALRVHVTRERVRQVEAKAIKRLRKIQRNRSAFESLLGTEKELAWGALCGGALSVSDARLFEMARRLDPLFLLAIDVVYPDIRRWIATIAHSSAGEWYRDESDAERLMDSKKAIRSIVENFANPVTPEQFRAITGLEPADNLTDEGRKWAFFEDYLCVGYLGPKAKRLVRMHRIAKSEFPDGMFDLCQLVRLYRQRYPEDDCGSRIFQMQADEAPHLFAPVFDNIWTCLPQEANSSSFIPSPPFERDVLDDDDFGEGTIGNCLASILSTNGPQRQTDLKELVSDTASGIIAAESSIGVILLSNPCFRRVAPGAYSLYHGDLELQQKLQPRLLEDRHCRTYCYARHGGAPADYYPAWGPSFEMLLAGWAKAHAPTDLYRSLLSIVEPNHWDTSDATITQWLELKDTEASWEIGTERRVQLGSRFIDPKQMFSVLTHLAMFGWVSWFAINRATGSKNDNHDAADVLALLVMSGLARPESDWQNKHEATDRAVEIFNRACLERHIRGSLSWDNGTLSNLLLGIEEDACRRHLGWINSDEARRAVVAWRSDELPTGKAYGGRQIASIDIENLFGSEAWNNAFSA